MHAQQLWQAAYQNSGLMIHPNGYSSKLNTQQRTEYLEEAIKGLIILYTLNTGVALAPEIQALHREWQTQADAYVKLCIALGLNCNKLLPNCHEASYARGNNGQTKGCTRQAVEALALYRQNFGRFTLTRAQYWPDAMFILDRYYYGLEELNEWLAEFNKSQVQRASCNLRPNHEQACRLASVV